MCHFDSLPRDNGMASSLLKIRAINLYAYAIRKNLTYESAVGGMQSPSGQHSIISAAVPDGDKSDRDVIENR